MIFVLIVIISPIKASSQVDFYKSDSCEKVADLTETENLTENSAKAELD